jgi:hypothetical protein
VKDVQIEMELRSMAEKLFMGCQAPGYGRMDFRMN